MYLYPDSALGRKPHRTALWDKGGLLRRGKCKSLFSEGSHNGHDSDIALAMIPLPSVRLSLPCVFSCKNEAQKINMSN